MADQATTEAPINGIHLFTGSSDYECPWGCCHINESFSPAPAQYLGYVPYAGN